MKKPAAPSPYVKDLKAAARALERARVKEAEAWADAQALMREAHTADKRLTFQEIADIFGVTKARIYQVVSGKRGGGKVVAKSKKAA